MKNVRNEADLVRLIATHGSPWMVRAIQFGEIETSKEIVPVRLIVDFQQETLQVECYGDENELDASSREEQYQGTFFLYQELRDGLALLFAADNSLLKA